MEYKDTLWMPKTDFEMRGKLPSKEPKIQAKWQEEKLYEKMLEKRDGAPLFVLHDGPPYANGDIHLGHGLNKTLKDVIVRSKFMSGFKTPFIPGWDTHGLPIETAITKMGHDRKKIAISDFRKLCHNFALEQVARQKEGFLSLGCIGDYDNPYITLQKDYEARQVEVFGKMAMQGIIYKGLKPVYWSPSSESALAEAEIEYQDVKSPTIFVKFAVKDGKGLLSSEDHFVIWTTTPWTIPANLAICLNERFTYALVKTEKGNIILLDEKVDELCDKFGLQEREVIKTFKGKELEMITCSHPLYDRESLIILGDHVSNEAGTGCVHTAPGFGADDFFVGAKYGLKPYCNVDEKGCMMADAGEWLEGQYVLDANKTVTQKLDELGNLLKLEFITHAYPHDWRTKKPIIFRATKQWFASIDKIRQQLLDEIAAVDWTPKWGQQRMHNMIADRGDWCISRQRAWGVPIPIFYAEDNTPIMDEKIFSHVSALFAQHGSNVWFERDVKDLLPEGYTHPLSPNNVFRKESDTMDVWFDSGSSHYVDVNSEKFPADLFFEGSDQYRGWFNSSLIISTAVNGKAPYKQVLSHGFCMDEKGVKMSKSQWNAVAPSKVTSQYGADILRLWATTVDYQQDCSMGDNILKQVSENYRKVRNTFKFLLGNINSDDFTKADMVDTKDLTTVDQHVLIKLYELSKEVKAAYTSYDFPVVTTKLTTFMTNVMSAYYTDFTKDILYIEKKEGLRRRQVQTVIYKSVDTLLRLWAPILSHTAEEITWFFDEFNGESIHLQTFNAEETIDNAVQIQADMDVLFTLRSDVFKAIEEARNEKIVGKSLEAHVTLHVSQDIKDIIDRVLGDALAQWLIVSKVSFTKETLTAYESVEVHVQKCEGQVCPRCWNITQSTHEDGLCARCEEVLK